MRLRSVAKLFFTVVPILSVSGVEGTSNIQEDLSKLDPAELTLRRWSAERLVLFLDIRNIPIPFDQDALLNKVKENAYLAPEITGFDPESFSSWTCQELADYLSGPHVENLGNIDLESLPKCSSSETKDKKSKKSLLDTAIRVVSERVGRVNIVGDTKPLEEWSIDELRSFLRIYRITYPLPQKEDLAKLAFESRLLPIQPLTLENPSDIFDSLTSEQIVEWLRVHQGLNIAVAVRTHYMSRPFSAYKRIEGLRDAAKGYYDEMLAKDIRFEDKFRQEIAEVMGMVHIIEGTGGDDIRVYYKNEDFEVLFDQFGVDIPKRFLKEMPRQTFIGSAKLHTYLFATGEVFGEKDSTEDGETSLPWQS